MATRTDRIARFLEAPALFANRFETAAFWASVAGVVLVVGISVARIGFRNDEPSAVAALEARIDEQTREIENLRSALEMARARADSLSFR